MRVHANCNLNFHLCTSIGREITESASFARAVRKLFEPFYEIALMNPNSTLGCLEVNWRNYLEEHGHRIYQAGSSFTIVRSRDGSKVRYRWLLLVGQQPIRRLNKYEREEIRHHLNQAKKEREHAYVVAGFPREPRRIVVLPADVALKARRVRPNKGGIAWND